jgi:tetratricopeptide (TPR) repeat protein
MDWLCNTIGSIKKKLLCWKKYNSKLDSVHKCLGYAYHQFSEALSLKDAPDTRAEDFRKKAISHYENAFKLNRQHYIAHNNLGNLYLEWSKKQISGKEILLKKAFKEFKKSLDINPRYHHAYDNLGNSFFELGKYDKAKEAYLNALLYKPDYPEAKNDLAKLFLYLTDKNENSQSAETCHREAIEMAKSDSQKQKLKKQFEDFKKKHFPIN